MSLNIAERSTVACERRLVLDKLNRAFSVAEVVNPETANLVSYPPIITNPVNAMPLTSAVTVVNTPSAVRLLGGAPQIFSGLAIKPVTTTRKDLSQYAYSGAFDIVTDAPSVCFGFTSNSVQARFLVDGRYVSRAITNATGGSTTYINLDFSSLRKVRRITVLTNAALRFIYTDPISRVTAPATNDIVRCIFTGDSYTASTGASMPDTSWSQVASRYLGIEDARACGIGGTGYLNPGSGTAWTCRSHINDVIDNAPDLVVFAHGANDFTSTPAAITAEVLLCLAEVRAALPATPIVVMGCWPLSSGPSPAAIATEGAILAAVNNFDDSFCKFAPVVSEPSGSWIFGMGSTAIPTGTGNGDVYLGGTSGTDKAHPNDAGHAYIGYKASEAIKKAVSAMTV